MERKFWAVVLILSILLLAVFYVTLLQTKNTKTKISPKPTPVVKQIPANNTKQIQPAQDFGNGSTVINNYQDQPQPTASAQPTNTPTQEPTPTPKLCILGICPIAPVF